MAGTNEKHENSIPKEATEDEAVFRVYAALSFVFMVIVIGFPLWWKTTEVRREPLPYADISSLKYFNISLQVNISICALERGRSLEIVTELAKNFRISELYKYNLAVVDADKSLLGRVREMDDLETATPTRLRPGEIMLLEVPGLSRFTPDQILVGRRRTVYFSTDAPAARLFPVVREWMLQEDSLLKTVKSLSSQTAEKDYKSRYRLPPAEKYNLLVTGVNPDPDYLNTSHWNLPQAVNNYINPFLDKLSSVAEFSVRSQWIYLTPLEVRPRRDPDGGFFLEASLLPQLITPLEKKLASHVSDKPCIHLLVYVPQCSESPLRFTPIGEPVPNHPKIPTGTQGFHSPRWGGLVLQNPAVNACAGSQPVQVDPEWPTLAETWLQHLRYLIGFPETPLIGRASIMQEPRSGVRLWEVDAIMRFRAIEYILSTRLTLQSLSALLEEINNIVIGKDVAEAVKVAVNESRDAVEFLSNGTLTHGLASARKAFLHAEAAFTDPSLLALLYFPDDQKYAVYIPLFLPVMIPVVMSLRNMKTWISILQSNKLKVD